MTDLRLAGWRRRFPAWRATWARVVLSGAVALGLPGCVERTVRIATRPTGAVVTLNDEEVGASPVKSDFLWYGDYDIVIRKPGYQTLKTHYQINAPWYEVPPLDLFSEALWPGMIHDERTLPTFELTRAEPPERAAVVDRAEELRDRAVYEGE